MAITRTGCKVTKRWNTYIRLLQQNAHAWRACTLTSWFTSLVCKMLYIVVFWASIWAHLGFNNEKSYCIPAVRISVKKTNEWFMMFHYCHNHSNCFLSMYRWIIFPHSQKFIYSSSIYLCMRIYICISLMMFPILLYIHHWNESK